MQVRRIPLYDVMSPARALVEAGVDRDKDRWRIWQDRTTMEWVVEFEPKEPE